MKKPLLRPSEFSVFSGLFPHGNVIVKCNAQNLSALEEVVELKKMLQKETLLRKAAEEEINNLKNQLSQWKRAEVCFFLSPCNSDNLVFSLSALPLSHSPNSFLFSFMLHS